MGNIKISGGNVKLREEDKQRLDLGICLQRLITHQASPLFKDVQVLASHDLASTVENCFARVASALSEVDSAESGVRHSS
jgi:hypothetical protein